MAIVQFFCMELAVCFTLLVCGFGSQVIKIFLIVDFLNVQVIGFNCFVQISIGLQSFAMTSASSSSARCLFAESKQRLAERVQVNMNNISSLARQIQRGSKSNELLSKAARDFAATENLMESSEENLKKMQLISVHMGYQFENIHKSAQMLTQISEQVAAMQR